LNCLRAYLAVLRGSFMVGMIYRFGFLFTILGNVVYMAVVYFLWRSIYAGATTLRGLTFDETFLYVALGSAVFILLKTYADWFISYEIREGIIAIYLTKPVDFQLYALAMSAGSALITLAAITVPTIVMLYLVFRVPFEAGPGLALFPVSLALAFLISFNFDFFIGVLSFYSESIWGTSITKEIIISVCSGALIPLQFFPQAIQTILLALPFQAIYYTPLMMVTRPDQGWDTYMPMLGVQLLWAVFTFVLSRLFYNQAVKVLRVAGG
jgi:ABC-2 type transport system permease protein